MHLYVIHTLVLCLNGEGTYLRLLMENKLYLQDNPIKHYQELVNS